MRGPGGGKDYPTGRKIGHTDSDVPHSNASTFDYRAGSGTAIFGRLSNQG